MRSSANHGMCIALSLHMVMRIEKSGDSKFAIYTLSGRIEKETIGELRQILALDQTNQWVAFDLKDIKLADQDSVEFLDECETQGVELLNCPPYLREWINRIRTRKF